MHALDQVVCSPSLVRCAAVPELLCFTPCTGDHSGHYGRPRAECAGTTAEALRRDGLPGRLSLRLCEEVRGKAHPGDWRKGRERAGRDDSVVPIADFSEPLHAGYRTLSRAPWDCGEQLLRSRAEADLLVSRSKDGDRWIV